MILVVALPVLADVSPPNDQDRARAFLARLPRETNFVMLAKAELLGGQEGLELVRCEVLKVLRGHAPTERTLTLMFKGEVPEVFYHGAVHLVSGVTWDPKDTDRRSWVHAHLGPTLRLTVWDDGVFVIRKGRE